MHDLVCIAVNKNTWNQFKIDENMQIRRREVGENQINGIRLIISFFRGRIFTSY